jgi:hypothetical protein
MADVTIYRDPAQVNIVVVDGVPPVDQTALVAQLEKQVADLTEANAALQTKITNAQAALA